MSDVDGATAAEKALPTNAALKSFLSGGFGGVSSVLVGE
jgi:hypothetical protein